MVKRPARTDPAPSTRGSIVGPSSGRIQRRCCPSFGSRVPVHGSRPVPAPPLTHVSPPSHDRTTFHPVLRRLGPRRRISRNTRRVTRSPGRRVVRRAHCGKHRLRRHHRGDRASVCARASVTLPGGALPAPLADRSWIRPPRDEPSVERCRPGVPTARAASLNGSSIRECLPHARVAVAKCRDAFGSPWDIERHRATISEYLRNYPRNAELILMVVMVCVEFDRVILLYPADQGRRRSPA